MRRSRGCRRVKTTSWLSPSLTFFHSLFPSCSSSSSVFFLCLWFCSSYARSSLFFRSPFFVYLLIPPWRWGSTLWSFLGRQSNEWLFFTIWSHREARINERLLYEKVSDASTSKLRNELSFKKRKEKWEREREKKKYIFVHRNSNLR